MASAIVAFEAGDKISLSILGTAWLLVALLTFTCIWVCWERKNQDLSLSHHYHGKCITGIHNHPDPEPKVTRGRGVTVDHVEIVVAPSWDKLEQREKMRQEEEV